MNDTMLYKRGDWVRFYRRGELVIGQVEYVEQDILGHWKLQTDAGEIREDMVLEARSG